MFDRVAAWWRQAESDLAQARDSLAAGRWEWACYAATQAAEKALKAMLLAFGAEAVWGHNIPVLLQKVRDDTGRVESPDLMDDARVLTQYNVIARYPTGDDASAPVDVITRRQAEDAVAAASRVLELARNHGVGR